MPSADIEAQQAPRQPATTSQPTDDTQDSYTAQMIPQRRQSQHLPTKRRISPSQPPAAPADNKKRATLWRILPRRLRGNRPKGNSGLRRLRGDLPRRVRPDCTRHLRRHILLRRARACYQQGEGGRLVLWEVRVGGRCRKEVLDKSEGDVVWF